MPRQTSVQLTEATERQIDALKALGYGSTTDIIRLAIDRMHRDETRSDDTRIPTGVQVWQHRTAGERYIVLVGRGGVEGAVGPIVRSEQDSLVTAATGSDWEWDAELADDIDAKADDYRVVWPYESA